jgi:hypothetical protein
MTDKKSERRMRENESVFRGRNESIVSDFAELKDIAEDAGQTLMVDGIDSPILFYCECSDEACNLRIKLRPSKYANLHKKRDYFTVIPEHEVSLIEEVIKTEPKYLVVRKFQKPNENVTELQTTDISNT